MISHPDELQWIEGDLPDVHTVSYDCRILIWKVFRNANKVVESEHGSYKSVPAPELEGQLKEISVAYPWKDDRNPLRWHDGVLPIGFEEQVKFYAWIKK
jgi:hypothetical protein